MSNNLFKNTSYLSNLLPYMTTGFVICLFVFVLQLLIPNSIAYSAQCFNIPTVTMEDIYPTKGLRIYEYVEQLN